MNKILNIAAILAIAFLTACGGSSAGDQPSTATSLVVLGDSLAVQTPNSNIGWAHTSGMAASDQAHDYAHLTASRLGLALTVTNVGDIERDPLGTAFSVIPGATSAISPHTIVVVQLGDELNVDKRNDFNTAYAQLLGAAQGAETLVCVSTWFGDPVTDSMIASACAAHGGHYVYIGDLYATRTDVTTGEDEDIAVALRPHDPSMALIAKRIVAALN